MLDEWNLKKDFRAYIMFNERACRKDWEGLDLQSLKKVFASLHGAGVAPKHIPNVGMRSLYDDFFKIHEQNRRHGPSASMNRFSIGYCMHRPLQRLRTKRRCPLMIWENSDAEVWALAKRDA